MMLAVAKVDQAWDDWYGLITTPRSFNSRWSRSKKNLRDLLIKNQRAIDDDARAAANAALTAALAAAFARYRR